MLIWSDINPQTTIKTLLNMSFFNSLNQPHHEKIDFLLCELKMFIFEGLVLFERPSSEYLLIESCEDAAAAPPKAALSRDLQPMVASWSRCLGNEEVRDAVFSFVWVTRNPSIRPMNG
jgi:hypothetical protein